MLRVPFGKSAFEEKRFVVSSVGMALKEPPVSPCTR